MDLSTLPVEDLEQGIEIFSQAIQEDQLDDGVSSIFEEFDEDKNGFLDRDELSKFFQSMFDEFKINLTVTELFLDEIFAEYDKDKNKKIDPTEMRQYLKTFLTNILELCKKELASKQ